MRGGRANSLATEHAGSTSGDTVAVWGCCPVAQMAIQNAWLPGTGRVIAIVRVRERLTMCRPAG